MTAYGTRRAGKVALFPATVVLPATSLAPTASSAASVASFSMLGADRSTGKGVRWDITARSNHCCWHGSM